MKYRALPRVVAAHMALIEERDAVVKRLTAVNEVLGEENILPEVTRSHYQEVGLVTRRPRTKGSPLIQMVLEFTQDEPKSVVEILRYLRAQKFKFSIGDPLNELLAAVEKSNAIKDFDGKLGPARKPRKKVEVNN